MVKDWPTKSGFDSFDHLDHVFSTFQATSGICPGKAMKNTCFFPHFHSFSQNRKKRHIIPAQLSDTLARSPPLGQVDSFSRSRSKTDLGPSRGVSAVKTRHLSLRKFGELQKKNKKTKKRGLFVLKSLQILKLAAKVTFGPESA